MKIDSSFKKSDVHARVTDEIVRAIEAGAKDYEMPWHRRTCSGRPRNAVTGNPYHGVNVIALWAAGQRGGYWLPYWATFLQWEKVGARVRRGEKASMVIFYKREELEPDEEGREGQVETRLVTRFSPVFNAEQVDGWSCPIPVRQDQTEKAQKVDCLIEALGADIHYGGDLPYYNPANDSIHMPDRRNFVDRATGTATEGFYSVLLHEHVHWTGSVARLNRDLSGRFGDSVYAMEELVAELGSAFLCADLDLSVQPRKDHAAYVASWLQVLRQQKSAIFVAASKAEAACLYLNELSVKQISDASCALQ